MSGVEVCKQLRAAQLQTPIIVLSALGDEMDKVLLLEIGADDYMVKPFGTREPWPESEPSCADRTDVQKFFLFGDVEVDLDRRAMTRSGRR